MTGPNIQETMATGGNAATGNASDTLIIPTGMTTARLTITGLDGSNTVKTQKRTTPGGAWVDQTTYNSNQSNVAVTVAAGEEWRILGVSQQAIKDISYKFSCES